MTKVCSAPASPRSTSWLPRPLTLAERSCGIYPRRPLAAPSHPCLWRSSWSRPGQSLSLGFYKLRVRRSRFFCGEPRTQDHPRDLSIGAWLAETSRDMTNGKPEPLDQYGSDSQQWDWRDVCFVCYNLGNYLFQGWKHSVWNVTIFNHFRHYQRELIYLSWN